MNRGIIFGIIGSLLAALTLAFIPIDQWVQYFPLWLRIIVISFLLLSFWGYKFYQWKPTNINGFNFKKITDDKYSMNINLGGDHIINIVYGKINDFQEYDKRTLVILPANDKFDDECIEDPGSVLGSFACCLYPNGNEGFKNDIRKELEKRNTESFNIGDWISIDVKSSISEFKIGIVAVTHKVGDDIIASSENVMLAFKGIHKIMTIKRISKVYMPLIGGGHGGLAPELSLLCLLISTIEQIRRKSGNMLRDVNIVVYKKDNGHRAISVGRMKRIVKFALNYCK
ncbi:MAG: hypothetical protein FWC41_12040 [Firmicutes bacterium]|nr:hypothetical protein [Bacillota bacterium]